MRLRDGWRERCRRYVEAIERRQELYDQASAGEGLGTRNFFERKTLRRARLRRSPRVLNSFGGFPVTGNAAIFVAGSFSEATCDAFSRLLRGSP
jgi:hypothetical protein